MSGPRPFRSVEEAYAFVKSHEIATNNKYVVAKSKGINTQDVSSLEPYKIQWEYSGMKAGSEKVDDGIPFVNLGMELRNCQYGPPRKRRNAQPTEDGEDTCNQEVMSSVDKNQQTPGSAVKRRRIQPSKKLNCLSKVKMKKIMKFPEYAVEAGKEYPSNFKNELGKQLKANFSENTKRYILVYVHIDNDHNHEATPIEEQHKHKKIVHVVDKGCKRLSGIAVPNIVPNRGPLLKKWANLKGKNLMDLAMQFKTTNELPTPPAQPKPDQKLEDMGDQELLSLYHDITGEMPNNMFSIANKEFSTPNLTLLLHLCIMFANAACDASRQSQVHPSVRIKGTESNFTPVQCLELDCAIVEPHMHCPFCAKTDSYTDPGLLKTHYTNRHVNKAIEFAGLRILRCYDICEVAGKNKGCKTFKGGHWHCYKCPNGLDKRNSVFDHYRSHLKNYESSFHIHVAQDVNPSMCSFTVPHEIDVSHVPWEESYNTAASFNTVSTTTKPNSCSSPLKRSYADTGLGDLETIDHTTMYVHDDGIGNVTSTYNAQEIPTTGSDTYVITVPDTAELVELKARVREFEMAYNELEKQNTVQTSLIELLQKKDADHTKLVEELKLEKQSLVVQLDAQKSEIENLKFAQKTSYQSAENTVLCSPKKDSRNKPRVAGRFELVPSDVDISLSKAKELEKNLKDCGKDTLITEHNYGTRRATRKFSTRKTIDHTYENENLNKDKSLTFPQKRNETSSDFRTSQPTTMEEMCNQLCTMRQEIELLKQTALGGSAVDMQHVSKQPLQAEDSGSGPDKQISNSFCNSAASFTVPSDSNIVQNMQDCANLPNTGIDNNLNNTADTVSMRGNVGMDVSGSLTPVGTGRSPARAGGNVDDLCHAARLLESSLPSD